MPKDKFLHGEAYLITVCLTSIIFNMQHIQYATDVNKLKAKSMTAHVRSALAKTLVDSKKKVFIFIFRMSPENVMWVLTKITLFGILNKYQQHTSTTRNKQVKYLYNLEH